MFAPVMKFWQTETPLHVVKVSRNARDELNLYRHGISTQSECDNMWALNFPDKPYEAWLERLAESWDRDLDHMNYGLGYHVPGDCYRCDQYLQEQIDDRNALNFSTREFWLDSEPVVHFDSEPRWFTEDYMSEDF